MSHPEFFQFLILYFSNLIKIKFFNNISYIQNIETKSQQKSEVFVWEYLSGVFYKIQNYYSQPETKNINILIYH